MIQIVTYFNKTQFVKLVDVEDYRLHQAKFYLQFTPLKRHNKNLSNIKIYFGESESKFKFLLKTFVLKLLCNTSHGIGETRSD